MQIPLVDLQAQYRTIKQDVLSAIEETLECMQLFLGPQTQAFERDFATYCVCRYGVGVATGTDALALALRACDIGDGDEVITVASTFIATVEAIALVGAMLSAELKRALLYPFISVVCGLTQLRSSRPTSKCMRILLRAARASERDALRSPPGSRS